MLAAGAACGGGGGGGGGANPIVAIAKAGAPNGDGQSATVNTALAAPLRVLVTEDGTPKSAATVQWSTTNGAVNPTSFTTGVDGIATTTWTLGTSAGAQTARATLAGATGSPVTFNATAAPGSPANLSIVAGSGQTAIQGGTFPTQLRVLVTDQFTNPVSGVSVSFTGSGGVLVSSPTANTGVNGEAVVSATGASSAGAGGVSAAVVGIAAPVNFTLTTAAAVREVTVGAGILFKSLRNNTSNPARDTISAGQGVLWRWAGGTHSVESTGAPTFTSSAVSSAVGNIYTLTFAVAGTYQYDCAVHSNQMTGQVVVQ
jgi:plastocyanin